MRTYFRSSVFCRLRRERSSTGGQPGMMGLWTGPVAKRATRANVIVRGSIAAAATTARGDITKKEPATTSKTTSCVCRRHRRLSVARLEKSLSAPCWSCVRFPCPAASRAGDDNSCSCSCPAPDAPRSSSPALTTATEATWNYRKSDRTGFRGELRSRASRAALPERAIDGTRGLTWSPSPWGVYHCYFLCVLSSSENGGPPL